MGRYRNLVIFVEGGSDKRFFEAVVIDPLSRLFDYVDTRTYAGEERKDADFVSTVLSIPTSEQIYVSDLDNCVCCSAKVQEVRNFLGLGTLPRVHVVATEIESWYLAGLDERSSRRLGLKDLKSTDKITKETFETIVKRKFDSTVDAQIEILKHFDPKTATRKNSSFKFFWDRYVRHCASTFG